MVVVEYIERMTKLYHFYHLWVGGNWKGIVTEHIDILKRYGLLDHLEDMYVGIVGTPDDRDIAKKYLDTLSFKYKVVVEADTGYEQITQTVMHKFSHENDGYVLYTHNKGSFHSGATNEAWRKSMTYHNVVCWRSTTKYLDTMDAVGCHWLTPEAYPQLVISPFFGGTFWWTKLSYLRTLDPPLNNSRYDAESWIGTKNGIKTYDLCPGWPAMQLFTTVW